MLTQCPRCHAIFKIDRESINIAEGMVECGECSTRFNAIEQQLVKNKTSKPLTAEKATADVPYQITSSLRDSPRPKSSLWLLGVIFLSLGAVAQYLLIQRETLSQKDFLRPVLESLCLIKGCTLPYISNVEAFELLEHAIESHPEFPNALLITGTLRNSAPFTQRFPLLELQMTDIEQNPIASRRFNASEYLPSGMSTNAIEAMTEVPVLLEIVDPGEKAVGFKFNFFTSSHL